VCGQCGTRLYIAPLIALLLDGTCIHLVTVLRCSPECRVFAGPMTLRRVLEARTNQKKEDQDVRRPSFRGRFADQIHETTFQVLPRPLTTTAATSFNSISAERSISSRVPDSRSLHAITIKGTYKASFRVYATLKEDCVCIPGYLYFLRYLH
jgi:hypothetical protein